MHYSLKNMALTYSKESMAEGTISKFKPLLPTYFKVQVEWVTKCSKSG